MKFLFLLVFVVLFGTTYAQNLFTNGDVEGVNLTNGIPNGWNLILPATLDMLYPDLGDGLEWHSINNTPDLLGVGSPSPQWGISGIPFSGGSFSSGLLVKTQNYANAAETGLSGNYHIEGIQQEVTGLTPGSTYLISLRQAVVQQINTQDPSGSWDIFLDDVLLLSTQASVSTVNYLDENLVWDLRTITFTATNSTHNFKFIPSDDDGDILSTSSPTSVFNDFAGIRMGLDSLNLTETIAVPSVVSVDVQDAEICFGTCVDLDAVTTGGIGTIEYSWDNGATFIANNSTQQFCPTQDTIISVIVMDDMGSLDTTTAMITVNPIPLVDLGNDVSQCDINLLLDAGNPGASYLWQDNSANQTFNVNSAGIYFVTVTLNGCSNSDTISVMELGRPVNLGADITTCSVDLTLDAEDFNLGETYMWSNGSMDQVISIQSPGTYWVNVEVGGCVTSDTIVITETPLVVILPNDTLFCNDINLLLDAGITGASYNWSTGATSQTLSVTTAGEYWVEVNLGNCQARDTVQVMLSEINVDFSNVITPSCETVDVQFMDVSTSSLSTISQWSWNFGDGSTSNERNPNHIYQSSGSYTVLLAIEDNLGCTKQVSQLLDVNTLPAPVAMFSFFPLNPIRDEAVQFIDESINATNLQWSFGDGQTDSSKEPTHTFNDITDFSICLVASNNSCSDTAKYTLSVNEDLIYYIPNAFTPDGNEYNNVFQPIFTSGFDPYNYHLTIYNRWGEVLFESLDATKGWDGTFLNGKLVPDGVYIWKIIFKNQNNDENHQIHGHVSVLR